LVQKRGGNPPKPYLLWWGKSELIGFEFFPISKEGVETGNRDIDTHPKPVFEPAPLILKLYSTSFKSEIIKQSLKLHSFIFYL
jgi:hypothetical protein